MEPVIVAMVLILGGAIGLFGIATVSLFIQTHRLSKTIDQAKKLASGFNSWATEELMKLKGRSEG